MRRTSFDTMRCSIARTLDVVGDPWTLLVVREAFFGTTRFDDFRRNLGIPRATLSARLATLVDHEVLERHADPETPSRPTYRLTSKGRALSPVMTALMQWGDQWSGVGEPPVTLLDVVRLLTLQQFQQVGRQRILRVQRQCGPQLSDGGLGMPRRDVMISEQEPQIGKSRILAHVLLQRGQLTGVKVAIGIEPAQRSPIPPGGHRQDRMNRFRRLAVTAGSEQHERAEFMQRCVVRNHRDRTIHLVIGARIIANIKRLPRRIERLQRPGSQQPCPCLVVGIGPFVHRPLNRNRTPIVNRRVANHHR